VEALERADRGALSRPDAGKIKCTVTEISHRTSRLPEIPTILFHRNCIAFLILCGHDVDNTCSVMEEGPHEV
jgi:hypothetical protein